jgi:hypothetical protein
MFSRDPLINLENFQKQVYFGYYLGFNSFDFKIDYKTVGPDIQVKKRGLMLVLLGFKTVSILIYVLSLVCTIQRDLNYPNFNEPLDAIRE